MTRLALISDIHYGQFSRTIEFSVPGEPIKDENSGGISLKNSMIDLFKREQVEYVCIAGDLTSVGSPQEFFYCENLILELAEKLNIPIDNIILGLGNHDIDRKIAELYKDVKIEHNDSLIDLVKEKYRQISAYASTINLQSIHSPKDSGPAPFSGVVENDKFVMIVLNTGWHCTKDQDVSHGKLDNEQLMWFKNTAEKYKDIQKWKVILMHHHAIKYRYHIPANDFSIIEESSELLDIAGKNGFHLILHGHRHHPRADTYLKSGWNLPITFVCAGSLAVNASHRHGGSIPNTLHIIDLTDEIGVINLYNYQYSAAQGWIPFSSNIPETPLDCRMKFGKLFSIHEINNSIQNLNIEKPLIWEDLDDCLKFMSFNDLNKRIEDHFNKSHKKIGHFPDEVVLLKK